MLRYYLFCFTLFFGFDSVAQPLKIEERLLLKKELQQYQAWVLSRDYFFGTTLKSNSLKALAWQQIYIEMLPLSYPEKEKLLAPYTQSLSALEIVKASQLAKRLHAEHKLLDSFSEEELLKLNALHLVMRSNTKKTGVVGRILPWFGAEKSNVLLRMTDSKSKEPQDPWYRKIVPLTVTHEGQFYATELAPGRYELFITTAGLNTSKQFKINKGEIRGLSLIDLRQSIPR